MRTAVRKKANTNNRQATSKAVASGNGKQRPVVKPKPLVPKATVPKPKPKPRRKPVKKEEEGIA